MGCHSCRTSGYHVQESKPGDLIAPNGTPLFYVAAADGAVTSSPNPGKGVDTGYRFHDVHSGQLVPVIARVGESRPAAIARVTSHHRR